MTSTPTRSTESSASSPSDSESNSKLSAMEIMMETMAYWQQVSLSLPRCSHLFVLRRPRTLVPTGPT